jgi:hypothetical protein
MQCILAYQICKKEETLIRHNDKKRKLEQTEMNLDVRKIKKPVNRKP